MTKNKETVNVEKEPKKKMSSSKKAIIIYTVELLVIAAVFATIATLEIARVIKISTVQHVIFNIVTTFGGLWLIADFVWASFSEKRKARVSYLDKVLHLPLGIYLICFDLIMYTHWNVLAYEVYLYGMTSAFYYVAACYTFEAIFHIFKPVPGFIDDEEDDKKEDPDKKSEPSLTNNDIQNS